LLQMNTDLSSVGKSVCVSEKHDIHQECGE